MECYINKYFFGMPIYLYFDKINKEWTYVNKNNTSIKNINYKKNKTFFD